MNRRVKYDGRKQKNNLDKILNVDWYTMRKYQNYYPSRLTRLKNIIH